MKLYVFGKVEIYTKPLRIFPTPLMSKDDLYLMPDGTDSTYMLAYHPQNAVEATEFQERYNNIRNSSLMKALR